MNRYILKNAASALLAAMFFLGATACTGTSSIATTDGTSGVLAGTEGEVIEAGDAAPADTTEESNGETNLGTIIGNPNTGKTALLIKTLESDTTVNVDGTALCEPFGFVASEPGIAHTQRCYETPEKYNAVVTEAYLVSCVDAAGLAVSCIPENKFTVATRVRVDNGEMAELAIDAIGASLDLSLANVTKPVLFGGIQLVTTAIGQTFPSASSAEAGVIIPALQGKNYRICATTNVGLTDEQMLKNCGNAEAMRGDIVIDMDGDGVYGFVDKETLAPGVVNEIPHRPERYDFVSSGVQKETFAFSGNPGAEYTDGITFGESEGVFAPILGFEDLIEILPEHNYDITATVDVTDSFFFIDGSRYDEFKNLCIGALSDIACEVDADPLSVGVYDPYFDGPIWDTVPTTSASVTELP